MKTLEALEKLNLVISDCLIGFEESHNWDKEGWEAMAKLLEEVTQFISEGELKNENN
jgi:hypothetical protein